MKCPKCKNENIKGRFDVMCPDCKTWVVEWQQARIEEQ
jgi:Zn finger protein HypA/HybF involved in hydrogenase expression